MTNITKIAPDIYRIFTYESNIDGSIPVLQKDDQ